jgi:hypothetical protein
MKKVTAVEQLQEWLNSHLSHDQQMQFEGLFQQSKDLERQQIIDAGQACFYCGWDISKGLEPAFKSSEQYYQETYKK